MGIIVTIGGGRYDNGEILPVMRHITELSGKPEPNILYVPTAGFDYIIGDEVIFDIFRSLGGKISNLFLTNPNMTYAYIERMAMAADIIYVGGGNLQFLMNTWKATGADKAFKKAYENGKILAGYSSGAMCWCKEGFDDCGENKSFVFVDSVGILPYSCCPHFDSGNWAVFGEEIKKRSVKGLAIENGAAVVFKDNEIYSLHGTDGGNAYFYEQDGSRTLIERKEDK